MADNIVKVGVEVSDNGSSGKTTKNVENLKDVLTQTEAAAKRVGKAISAMSTQAPGSATVMRAKQASEPTGAAASQAYGVARGAIGTGAEARDFAKQSQGLGGLVRVYATFAANIFAATAAFQALSKAADTANLVQGLDQLGAASGKNLGFVAKQLVQATDGAVSLRDALKATAQASAAGLSSENILKLGIVAKQASQALGVDMGDALNRLSRGVTKLEPELLDELGIFTRVDKASQDYARSIGRSALSLSDFEKRQAFANAVLAEGKAKFDAINLVPNPYSKIAANLQNLSDTSLGFINKVLTPLLTLLSNSPTALALGIGYIAKTLLSQALPALSQWKVGLAEAAAQAKQSATNITESFGAAYVQRLENSLRIPDLKKQIKDYETDLKKLSQIPQSLQKSKAVSGVLSAGAEATPGQLGGLTREINARKTQVEALSQATDKASKAAIAGYNQEIAYLEKLKLTTKGLIATKAELNVVGEKAVDIATNETASLSETARRRIADAAIAKSARLNTLLPVAERTRELGFLEARKMLLADTAEAGITGFNKFRTVATGTLTGLATSAGLFVEAFAGPILAAIAAITVAYQLLDFFFSKNGPEVEKFNSAIEASHTSVDTLNRTLDNISKKPIDEVLSVKSIAATAEALTGLSSSLEDVVRTLDKANIKASGFDKFIDGFLVPLGKDLKSKFAEEIAYSVSEGFKALPEGAAKQEAEKKLTSILGNVPINFVNIKQAVSALPNDKVVAFGQVLSAAMTKASASAAETSRKLTEVSSSLDAASKAYDEFVQAQASTDTISKLGASFIASGIAMNEAFKDPINSLITLRDLVKDTSRLRLLPEDAQKDLLAAKGKIDALSLTITQLDKEIANLSKPTVVKDQGVSAKFKQGQMPWERQLVGPAEPGQLDIAKAAKAAAEAEVKVLVQQFGKTGDTILSRGLDLIYREVSLAGRESALTVSKAIASGMSGVGTADVTASLRQEELAIQQEQIDITQSLNYTMIRANILGEEANALKQVELNQAERAQMGPLSADYEARAEKALDRLAATQTASEAIKPKGITRQEFEKLTPEIQKIVFPYFQASLAAQLKTQQLKGQQAAAVVEQKAGRTAEQEAVKKRELQYALETKNIELQRLGLLTAGSTIINEQLLAKKQALEVDTEAKTTAIKINDIDVEIAKAQKRATDEADPKRKAAFESNAKDLETQKLNTIELAKQNAELSAIRRQAESLKNTNELALANLAQQNSTQQTLQAQESARLDVVKAELDYRISLGLLTETAAAAAQSALAKEIAALELKKQLSDAAYQNEVQLNAIRLTTATQLLAAKTPEDQASVMEQGAGAEARVNALYADRIWQINTANAAKLAGLEIDEKQKTQLAQIADLTNMLGGAFGDLGTKIAGAAATLMQFAAANEALAAEEKKSLEDKIEGTSAYEYQQKLNADKRTKFELDSTAKIANSSKKMFKEKSAMYKTLDAVEKASQMYRLGLSLAENAQKIALWWQEVQVKVAAAAAGQTGTTAVESAGFFSRIPMYISEIYAKTIGQLGIFGPPVAAALVAMALGAFGGGGKGGGNVDIPTAQERQEKQGRGTVLGDETAQSNSIKNSLDIIAATNVEDLSFSNQMVNLLRSIDKGIGGAAKGLYNLQGLRGGTSAFGTLEGTSASGINIPVLGGLFSSSTTRTINDTGIVIKGFFTDLLDYSKMARGVIQQYEEVITVRKKSGFFGIGGSTKTRVSYNYKDLPDENLTGLIQVFENANSLILTVGEKLGMKEQDILNVLKQVDISTGLFSLKGLSGKDLEAALGALVNGILDKAAGAVFGVFEKYQKMGEGLLETVIRVVDANDKINLALTSIGKNTLGIGIALSGFADSMKLASFDISEALVDAAGGLQNFLDQAKSFRENFLTEAEQMAPIREAVTTEISRLMADIETTTTTTSRGFFGIGTRTITTTTTETSELTRLMRRLGIATLDTKEEFKLLVQAVDLTTESGRELYQQLMNVAPTFAKLEDYEKKLADARLDQESKILELLNRTTTIRDRSRAKELAALDDTLKPTQLYIYALEDEADIRDKLLKARDAETAALEKTISTLKTSIQTLKDYKNSLLTGSISTLTPEQKYQQTKQTALELAAVAQGPASTPAEIAARDAALAKLPAATTAWLEASRISFASGAQYTQDFNSVLSILDATSTALGAQQTDAEKQLAELKSSTSFLDSIDANVATVATLLPQYLTAQAATQTALGNLNAGVIGDLGLTNTPATTTAGVNSTATAAVAANGTVTPTNTVVPTNITVAANEQLAATITQLRTEIAGLNTQITTLRTEQQAQATTAVVSTYDASNLNAQAIREGLSDFYKSSFWMNRNRVEIV